MYGRVSFPGRTRSLVFPHLNPLVLMHLMVMDCMTWQVMSGNGHMTGIEIDILKTKQSHVVFRSILEAEFNRKVMTLPHQKFKYPQRYSKVVHFCVPLIIACAIVRQHGI